MAIVTPEGLTALRETTTDTAHCWYKTFWDEANAARSWHYYSRVSNRFALVVPYGHYVSVLLVHDSARAPFVADLAATYPTTQGARTLARSWVSER